MERNILIVSRANFLREMVRFALKDLPAAIHCTADAEGAARVADRTQLDCILLLGAAPLLGGGREAAVLRSGGVRRPKLVVVAWQHAEQTVLGLLENGVDQYMTFPVNLQRLYAKVAGIIDTRI